MRLIDADALVSVLRDRSPKESTHTNLIVALAVGACIHEIDNANTIDAVPVVLCKDCENWNYQECVADGNCWCDKLEKFTWKNFFCADGERRGKDEAD